MSRRRLLVLCGGASSEHEISLRSARSVIDAVDPTRFETLVVGIGRDRRFRTGPAEGDLGELVASGTEVGDLRQLEPDVVFPVLHGPSGEDGTIQGMLEILGLPYVGSGVLASALCMDKAVQKQVVATAAPDVPLVPWMQLDARSLRDEHERLVVAEEVMRRLGTPCFVKPANLGSSVGVHKATDVASLATALAESGRHDHKLVVEKGIDARELEVAILGNGDDETIVSAPGEIELPPGVWYDYETKYLDDVATLHIPASVPEAVVAEIRRVARRAFVVTGCAGLARVDFLLDRGTGVAYLNELNTMPGFTSISMYPKLVEQVGIPYSELVTRLCELGLATFRDRQGLSLER